MIIKPPEKYYSDLVPYQHNLTLGYEDLPSYACRSKEVIDKAIELNELVPIRPNTFKTLQVCGWAEKFLFEELAVSRGDPFGFFKTGYINKSRWLDPSVVDEIREYSCYLEENKRITKVYKPDIFGVIKIDRFSGLHNHQNLWKIISTNYQIHNILQSIYGIEPYVFTNTRIVVKYPNMPAFCVHRDGHWTNLCTRPEPSVTLSISLDDAGISDGGVGFLPGTNTTIVDTVDSIYNDNDFTYVEPGEGSLLLISQGMLHWSRQNDSPNTRRSLQINVASKKAIDSFIANRIANPEGKKDVTETFAYKARNFVFGQ